MGNASNPQNGKEKDRIERFAAIARGLRIESGRSQAQLAIIASLSASTIRGWEAGRSEPSLPELGRWGQALELPEWKIQSVQATLLAPRAWSDRPSLGLGPYLRERRLAVGRTLSRAAAELNIPLATLGHYESGRVEMPTEVLSAVTDLYQLEPIEASVVCEGMAGFLDWCDRVAATPSSVLAALNRAMFPETTRDFLDRGPSFIRIRTGLLRARLRNDGPLSIEATATAHHAYWLAVGERRTEASANLGTLPPSEELSEGDRVTAVVAYRYLGTVRSNEILTIAEKTERNDLRAWLRSEAALDLCERRRGRDALQVAAEAIDEVASEPQEAWMRRRDLVRVAIRCREWAIAQEQLDGLTTSPWADMAWHVGQIEVLQSRIERRIPTARMPLP